MIIHLLNSQTDFKTYNNNVDVVQNDKLSSLKLSKPELELLDFKNQNKQNIVALFNGNKTNWVVIFKADKKSLEDFRCLGADLAKKAQAEKADELNIDGSNITDKELLALAEGFVLESYRFLKYFKAETKSEKLFSVKQLNVFHDKVNDTDISFINNTLKAVFWARDMVNEPVNFMNSIRLSQEITMRGQESGLKVEVLDKTKIEALRMGGLLAVNKGSIDPPTFTICEWKPKNAVNKKPFVLVGKGIVYDTGGLSLKPTAGSMDLMKSDMGGAATVAATMYSLSLNELPVWVIALIPATDNRPDGNAYTPGDIIKMYNGLNVEVLNTDAEGRMILADALSYGDKYDPELSITVATLTGSAAMAIGSHGSVYMGNANKKWFDKLGDAADKTHERLVQFPFWGEYGEAMKSDIADLKNIGSREGGAISAGKFLENFTKSPYIHFDIAGTAFLTKAEKYKPKGGTGVAVRMFTEFFRELSK